MRLCKALIVTLALGLLVAPLAADAQPAGKVVRVGFLATMPTPPVEAFRGRLRDLGYVEGQNILIEFRWSQGKFERFPDLAAELVRLKVDVIVASGDPAALAAKQATSTIPIVMSASRDPVGAGLVASLSRPGGNVTGLSYLTTELSGKRLELLREAVPGIARVAVLWNATNRALALDWREIQVAAQAIGVTLESRAVRGPNDFEGAFSAMARERADALITLGDPLIFVHQARIIDFAAKNRLPAMFHTREFADAGGLMAYGPNVSDTFRRAATYVDKVLKGAKPADLPIEQPTKFELVINLKTAKALGLTIPQSVLIRADQVIQ